MVAIEGIKDSIATQPFLAADATIPIEIIEQEDLLGCMGKGGSAFQHSQSMGQLSFQGFDRFGEALDAFGKLLVSHAVFSHHLLEALGIDAQFLQLAAGVAAIELAHQGSFLVAELIEEFGGNRQQITAGQLDDFVKIAEAGSHHLGCVAVLFEVVEDLGDRHHAGIFRPWIAIAAGVFLVPIKNPANEG